MVALPGLRAIGVALFPHPSWAAASASNAACGVVIVQSCRLHLGQGVWSLAQCDDESCGCGRTHTRDCCSRLLNNSVGAARRSIASLNMKTSCLAILQTWQESSHRMLGGLGWGALVTAGGGSVLTDLTRDYRSLNCLHSSMFCNVCPTCKITRVA